jgi:hypothetical protein
MIFLLPPPDRALKTHRTQIIFAHNSFFNPHKMTMGPTISDTHNFTSTQPIPTSKYIPDSSAPILHIKIGFGLITWIFSIRYHYQSWGTIF